MSRKREVKTIKVVCLECGRKFRTASALPECPKCGGSDIDVDDETSQRQRDEASRAMEQEHLEQFEST